MTAIRIDERDYSAWNALLIVLSSTDAERAARTLVPGLPVGESIRSIALTYLREARVAQTNEAAHSALTAAVSRLRHAVGEEGFISYEYARRLFEPDTTDSEAVLAAWVRVLTHWLSATHPPAVAGLLEAVAPALAIPMSGDPFSDGLPDWQFLVEFAQGRLVGGHLRVFLVSQPTNTRRRVLEDFASTAISLGIPRQILASATLGDASSRDRPN